MDLGGTWLAAPSHDDLRRRLPDRELDDNGWETIVVPGHWQSTPTFAASQGPLLYRRNFETGSDLDETQWPLAPDRRAWLTFEGVLYQGDVWLDGAYLGDTEGYFFPHTFEVTDALRKQPHHSLAVEVSCAPQQQRRAKRNLTGALQNWVGIDPSWNPGGIWAPVHVSCTGPVRISALSVVCVEATAESAILEFRTVLDTANPRTVSLDTAVGPESEPPSASRHTDHALAAGPNVVRWRMAIDRPRLWWPHALGDQPLYEVNLVATVDGRQSDRRCVRTGLRQIRLQRFVATINGEALFLKGACYGPTRRALGEADEMETDVHAALDAGLDLLRVHAHVGRRELYEAADRAGLLIWQDLPLQYLYQGIRRQAVRQATAAVDQLGHHPSVVLWCGHDEPFPPARWPEPAAPMSRRWEDAARRAAGQLLPTRNKTTLDGSLKRALSRADGSRPVISHSGLWPHPIAGTDSRLPFGWERGNVRDVADSLARLPVLARFVTVFGPQAVPETASFCQPERWPNLDWDELARSHCLDRATLDWRVPPSHYPTFSAWRAATQAYQAAVMKHYVETLRRLKYRPTGGFCVGVLADAQAAITPSVLDHQRVPKAAFQALRAACAPVIVVADPLEAAYRPGQHVASDLHVVSDLRHSLHDAELRAELHWPGGHRTRTFRGDIPADSCVRVGELDEALPGGSSGPVSLRLRLRWEGGAATNRYDARLHSDTYPGARASAAVSPAASSTPA